MRAGLGLGCSAFTGPTQRCDCETRPWLHDPQPCGMPRARRPGPGLLQLPPAARSAGAGRHRGSRRRAGAVLPGVGDVPLADRRRRPAGGRAAPGRAGGPLSLVLGVGYGRQGCIPSCCVARCCLGRHAIAFLKL